MQKPTTIYILILKKIINNNKFTFNNYKVFFNIIEFLNKKCIKYIMIVIIYN